MRYLLIFLIISLFSCKSDDRVVVKSVVVEGKLDNDDEAFVVSLKKERLHGKAIEVVENWQEYQAVSEFMPRFYKTSTKEVLFNSSQFYKLTTYLKDSIRIDKFNKPSFKIRLNVLNNEALRLFDMDSISNISNKEVIAETNNIINAFNALNIKINNEIKKDVLMKDLSEFNHLFEKETNDTLTIKPINQEKRKDKEKSLIKRKKLLKNKRIKPLYKKNNVGSLK